MKNKTVKTLNPESAIFRMRFWPITANPTKAISALILGNSKKKKKFETSQSSLDRRQNNTLFRNSFLKKCKIFVSVARPNGME